MPWSWPTQRGVLVALTVAIGSSNARIGGAVGSAAGAAEADWPAPPAAGWPLGGAGDGAAAPDRAAGALGAVQASNAKTSPTAAQRSQRTTSSLLGRSGRAPEGPNPPAPLPSEGRGERTDRSPRVPRAGRACASPAPNPDRAADRARPLECVHYTRRAPLRRPRLPRGPATRPLPSAEHAADEWAAGLLPSIREPLTPHPLSPWERVGVRARPPPLPPELGAGGRSVLSPLP